MGGEGWERVRTYRQTHNSLSLLSPASFPTPLPASLWTDTGSLTLLHARSPPGRIPDPTATKPEDWDEDAPEMIPDEEAVKPEGWLDEEPLEIDDPGGFCGGFVVDVAFVCKSCCLSSSRGGWARRPWRLRTPVGGLRISSRCCCLLTWWCALCS